MQVFVYPDNVTVGGAPYALLRITFNEAEALRDKVREIVLANPNRTNDPANKRGCPINQAWIALGGNPEIVNSNVGFRDMIKPIIRQDREVGVRGRHAVRWLEHFQRLIDEGYTFGEANSKARARY